MSQHTPCHVDEYGGISHAPAPERVVACVNACAGIPTKALESGVVADLLEVCQAFIGRLGADGYYPAAGKPLTDKMRAAIAKATNPQETP